MKQRNKEKGSTNDDWATPQYILDWVTKTYGSFFDPCPLKHNLNQWDGLDISWAGVNFVNPPYNNKGKVNFIKKAYEEYKEGNISILLIPATIDIPIFHDIILKYASVYFVKGRVKFKGYNQKGEYVTDKAGQSGSMIVIFDPRFDEKILGSFNINNEVN